MTNNLKAIKAEFMEANGKWYTAFTESSDEQTILDAIQNLEGATLGSTSTFMQFPNLSASDASFESEGSILVNTANIRFLTYSMVDA